MQLPIPPSLQDCDGQLIWYMNFQNLYSIQNDKQTLWETIFDIDRLQKRRTRYASNNDLIDATYSIQLSYGLKTDGHMVSVLFEKTTNEFLALDITEYKKLKQNKDISEIKSVIYPLYKRPIGLSENDRIIGIDPVFVILSVLLIVRKMN
ncbi:MAG: hypothetical protein EXX96DRAFT_294619 [Benjaminiella poitrasii]|nr:MAG: hypothetical protein EXX96DRAFT_294619 [Benjaminiella poitrasii]